MDTSVSKSRHCQHIPLTIRSFRIHPEADSRIMVGHEGCDGVKVFVCVQDGQPGGVLVLAAHATGRVQGDVIVREAVVHPADVDPPQIVVRSDARSRRGGRGKNSVGRGRCHKRRYGHSRLRRRRAACYCRVIVTAPFDAISILCKTRTVLQLGTHQN